MSVHNSPPTSGAFKSLTEPLTIGIDTGGTCTDAVIIRSSTREVLAHAKALTTKGDLAIGVGEALATVLSSSGIHPADVGLVTVSTTLATNAVVEGHADRVAVVLVGFDDAMADRSRIASTFPHAPIIRVSGGHDHNGSERDALDEVHLRNALSALRSSTGALHAVAVASAFAVRNPAHERRTAELVREICEVPVTTSSEITSSLDAPRRAFTAVLNAQLVGKIAALVDAVQGSMTRVGLRCPLMLVKGDGSRALASAVRLRPIETVLSGPAASLIGAAWLTQQTDFVMSDIGGTTTDVALLRDGRPQLAEHGASVGGTRTMVRAIDIATSGLGGDSDVRFDGTLLSVGPQRVIPLSLLASRHPEILATLDADLADTRSAGIMHGRFVCAPFGSPVGSPVGSAGPHGHSEDQLANEIKAAVAAGPKPLRALSVSPRAQRTIETLRKTGHLQLAAFTPTDAAHVLGMQSTWNRDAAMLGALLGARFRAMAEANENDAHRYAHDVWSETVRLSAHAFLTALAGEPTNESPVYNAVARGAVSTGPVGLLAVAARPLVPLVGVGGPAPVFYPEVARRLDAELLLPEFGSVANAVGAATGVVTTSVTVGVNGNGDGLFHAQSTAATQVFTDATPAIDWVTADATAYVTAELLRMGAREPAIRVSIERSQIPGMPLDLGLMRAEVTVEATGWPQF